jgi:hypothetical protein
MLFFRLLFCNLLLLFTIYQTSNSYMYIWGSKKIDDINFLSRGHIKDRSSHFYMCLWGTKTISFRTTGGPIKDRSSHSYMYLWGTKTISFRTTGGPIKDRACLSSKSVNKTRKLSNLTLFMWNERYCQFSIKNSWIIRVYFFNKQQSEYQAYLMLKNVPLFNFLPRKRLQDLSILVRMIWL